MDNETISTLQTVCAAGGARAGFNGDANARLEELVEAGLLAVANPSGTETGRAAPRTFYRPTKKGITLAKMAKAQGAA
jgi:predicted ArsR family transcriptional regulator